MKPLTDPCTDFLNTRQVSPTVEGGGEEWIESGNTFLAPIFSVC